MKYFNLDKEEKMILQELDEGNFVVLDKKEKEKYIKYAKATLAKARNINIRLSEKDLQKTKEKAADQGIPYQTLISSIIHQYVGGKVKMGR